MKTGLKRNGRKKIGAKLILIMLLLGLIPLSVSNYLSYRQACNFLEERAVHQLNSIRDVKKAQIESYFKERIGDMKVLTENPLIVDGINGFNKIFEEEGIKGLSYKELENTIGRKLKNYVEAYGYYDLFLINKAGNVVYTVSKEKDFGINLLSNEYKDLSLSKIFNKSKSGINLQDFEYYEISGKPAAFIGGPVKGGDGVVVLQISIDQLNSIMQERSGLGETGETYIVGKDGFMRTDSIFFEESAILKKKIETEAVKAGVEGKTDIMNIKDYRGISIFSSYAPLGIKGVNWIILAEIDKDEILSSTIELRIKSFIVSGISAAIIILSALFLSKQITTPIKHLMEIMGEAKEGNLLVEAKVKANDELGDLADSFNEMIKNIGNLVKNSYEIIEKMEAAILNITNSTNEIGQVSNEISAAVEEIASGSNVQAKEASQSFVETNALAQKIDKIIEKSEDTIGNTEEMKEKSDLGVKTIAELKVSLNKNTEASNQVAHGIEDLTEKSKSIGDIVETINSIAEQTNLLALNAAIEAARAGDSGKGFAVVAEEVRKLAEESRNATEQIKVTIDEIKVVIENTQTSMKLGSQLVKDVDASLLDTEKSFNEINESIDDTVENIKILNEFAENIDEAKNNVLSSIENISAITEQSSSSTEEVNASIEEQTAAIEEVSASMQDINDMVQKLDSSAKIFKI